MHFQQAKYCVEKRQTGFTTYPFPLFTQAASHKITYYFAVKIHTSTKSFFISGGFEIIALLGGSAV